MQQARDKFFENMLCSRYNLRQIDSRSLAKVYVDLVNSQLLIERSGVLP